MNICVARLAIPVILRNLFNQNKTLVVWHYYDAYDGKSKFLRRWYHTLVNLAFWTKPKKLSFIVVAPFWKKFFGEVFGLKQIWQYPNFFDNKKYFAYRNGGKKKQIHLGQVSFKNSNELFLLAEQLTQKGYQCYFSTNHRSKVIAHPCYEVRYFENHDDYLREMAASQYTLAMPFIREGWNRVAHESLLLGTQVIGFDKGGLGDLLRGANAFIVGGAEEDSFSLHGEHYRLNIPAPKQNPVEQAMNIILSGEQLPIHDAFLNHFDITRAEEALQDLKKWIKD